MTDPREDALAKAREALTWYAIQVAGCRKVTGEGEDARRALDRDGGQQATEALAALSAPPSQSESDDEKRLRSVLSVALDALRMHVNRDPKAMEATHDALGYAEQEFG